MRLERQAAGAEAVVLRDQFLGHSRILHALTDLARNEIGDQRIGLAIHQDIAEVALPDAEAWLAVEFLEERLAFLGRNLERGAWIGAMDEAAGSFVAECEDLGIAIPDLAHLFFGDPGVMQRRAPVGGALEDRQLADFLGDGLDGLHGGRPGADHRDPLAFEVHRFLRPEGGVAGLTSESVNVPKCAGIVGAESTPMAVMRKRV